MIQSLIGITIQTAKGKPRIERRIVGVIHQGLITFTQIRCMNLNLMSAPAKIKRQTRR